METESNKAENEKTVSGHLKRGVSLPLFARQTHLGDEIVFKGGKYDDGNSIQEGIITLISLKGVQVFRKVSIGQHKEQLFVKWDKIVSLRKAG